MKTKTKAIIILACVLGATVTLAACAYEGAPYRELSEEQGGIVKVVYEANGGTFNNNKNMTLVDSYPLSAVDSERGAALVKPGSKERDKGTSTLNSGNSTPQRSGYQIIGWYQTCSQGTRVNEDGEPLDEDGVICTKSEKPQGNVYEDMWCFTKEDAEGGAVSRLTLDMCTLVSDKGETPVYEFRLYAAWQPSISYKFFRPTTEEERKEAALKGETVGYWKEYASRTLTASNRYLPVPALPSAGGEIEFSENFPQVPLEDFGGIPHTLSAIYRDPAQRVAYAEDSGEGWLTPNSEQLVMHGGVYCIEHSGGVDYERGYAYDTTVNLYTTWKEGRYFRIKDASQMTADAHGVYYIDGDLDFSNRPWNFSGLNFEGKMIASEPVTIRNINATQALSQTTYGGVFGSVAAGAEIRNIAFTDVTLNLTSSVYSMQNEDTYYGLFAGLIDADATVTGITAAGKILIGGGSSFYVDNSKNDKLHIGLVSGNAEKKGIGNAQITVERVARTYFDPVEGEFTGYGFTFEIVGDTVTLTALATPEKK